MAGLVITSNATSINIVTNEYVSDFNADEMNIPKSRIGIVIKYVSNEYVTMGVTGIGDLCLNVSGGVNKNKVDSIDGVEIDSIDLLFTKLTSLR